jgi:HAMP domain-containing protein
MKRIILMSAVIAGLLGLLAALPELGFRSGFDSNRTGGSGLFAGNALAAKPEPKAGMVDPKTGKKIKYWASPMDPTYIRDEPGKSPMGMDLVPVYEEEGDGQESASTIRIDPVTMQNMGVRLGRVQQKTLIKNIRTIGNITFKDEIGELIHSFNTMVLQLEERIRLKEDLDLAMEVQQNLLPQKPLQTEKLDIAGKSI